MLPVLNILVLAFPAIIARWGVSSKFVDTTVWVLSTGIVVFLIIKLREVDDSKKMRKSES